MKKVIIINGSPRKNFNTAKEFSKQRYQNCDALVLDLRGNGGGWPYIGD